MVGARTEPNGSSVPTHARTRPRTGRSVVVEAGFTIVELLVVMIIVSILAAITMPQLAKTREKTSGPLVNLGAGTLWRGVMNYRLENHGVLPTAGMLASEGATFTNPANARYVKRWPDDATGNAPLVVTASNAASAPATTSANRRGTVLYAPLPAGSANPTRGWLAAYAPTGQLVFRRSIGTNPADPGPIG